MDSRPQEILSAYQASQSLLIFREIARMPLVETWRSAAAGLLHGDDPYQVLASLTAWAGQLLEAKTNPAGCWAGWLATQAAAGDNSFGRRCAAGQNLLTERGTSEAVQSDLRNLQKMAALDYTVLVNLLHQAFPALGTEPLPALGGRTGGLGGSDTYADALSNLAADLAEAPEWSTLAPDLVAFYQRWGTGRFARFHAFVWTEEEQGGSLLGVAEPDPIRLENLTGCEDQKAELLRNTRQFLRGGGANNVLLYGDRGTGKSSMVKALLSEFADRRLRLVEIPRYHLRILPQVVRQLRQEPYYFILFIDDLSFEAHETEYKFLKAILEGSVEQAPHNVLVYATSNRRHLIQEYFGERQGDEIHARDSRQEKLSLADRFGITLTFSAPDQEEFLAIVAHQAQEAGLALPADQLAKEAIRWAMWHNDRSGRSARQFITYLQAGE